MMRRAYSTIEVKAVSDSRRTFTGIASTPSVDRMGDVVEPKGAIYKLPIPLLWQHDAKQPIGWITKAKITDKGIEVEGEVASVEEDGTLKGRLTEAWQMLKAGLVRGLSIGFAPREAAELKGSFGTRFLKWEWLELSAVTIPANGDASLTTIKAIDKALLAASGHGQGFVARNLSGVSENTQAASRGRYQPTKETQVKTLAELKEAKAAAIARMDELMTAKEAESRDHSDDEAAEYDGLVDEVKQLDGDIRVAQLQQIKNITRANPVRGSNPDDGAATRAPRRADPSIGNVRSNDTRKGMGFTRAVIALANAKGNFSDAIGLAQMRWKDAPEVTRYLKAVAGSTTGWGLELTDPSNLAGEYLEMLRPMTYLGKIQGFRRVPFNVRVLAQSAASTIGWVGEAAAKPVGELDFEPVTLGIDKIAGIVVLTDELIKVATPAAEELVRTDLLAQSAQFLDQQFIDPAVAETANNPASITNGVTPITSAGGTADDVRADLRAMRAAMRAAGITTSGTVLLTNGNTADFLADLVNPLGQPEFPEMSSNGGTIRGQQVIVSDNVPGDSGGAMLVLLKPSEILMADDGGVRLDASREATLDMAGGNSPTFSLWQKNCVALRAERMITWKVAREGAVQYIADAVYDGA